MKIVLRSSKDHIQPDWGFLLYFTGMFTMYKFTYFQLAIQLLIIAYVFIKKLYKNNVRNNVKMKLNYDTIMDLVMFCLWLGMLAFMLYFSRETYAIYRFADSSTALTMLRIFTIGFIMVYYIRDMATALSVLESMVLAVAIMCFVVMIITPPSAYFVASDTDGFGSKIAQHRNQIGAATATMFLANNYLQKYAKFKLGYLLGPFFIIIVLLTGSRGSMLQLMIEIILILLFNGDFIKLFFLGLAIGGVVLIIINIPALYENVWVRFMNAADVVANGGTADSSAVGRQLYKEIALKMFQNHPLRGYGTDGFKGYLTVHPFYNGYYLPAVYSHCNYAELMSCFGIIGLVIWYVPILTLIIRSLYYRKASKYLEMTFILLLAMSMLDQARIPWSTHLGTYPFIIAFIIIRVGIREYKIKLHQYQAEKKNKSKQNKTEKATEQA